MKSNKISFFLLHSFLILISLSLAGQNKKNFSCPINSGTIVIVHDDAYEYGKRTKDVLIEGQDSNIYSVSSGKVYMVILDSLNQLTTLRIKYKKYVFNYYDLAGSSVKVGQSIKRGQLIGKRVIGEKLSFGVYYMKKPIDPFKILECKVEHVYN